MPFVTAVTIWLEASALLLFAVGVVHSVLGERYILVRLFRRTNLPELFGDTTFTTRTLRFAWHVTTVAWWGFAAILLVLARQSWTRGQLLFIVAATFLLTGAIILIISHGRHWAWAAFLFIGSVCLYAAAV